MLRESSLFKRFRPIILLRVFLNSGTRIVYTQGLIAEEKKHKKASQNHAKSIRSFLQRSTVISSIQDATKLGAHIITKSVIIIAAVHAAFLFFADSFASSALNLRLAIFLICALAAQ